MLCTVLPSQALADVSGQLQATARAEAAAVAQVVMCCMPGCVTLEVESGSQLELEAAALLAVCQCAAACSSRINSSSSSSVEIVATSSEAGFPCLLLSVPQAGCQWMAPGSSSSNSSKSTA
jgi:hypothetical protein